ncbi:MAG: hypothetical protein M1825_000370 [Sarcosagium campestre]|nr:MAG: hypothetical protein M1825_000370 [Sarcosagium campestre]
MSGNLDKSLDEIVSARPRGARRGRGRGSAVSGSKGARVTSGPAGGITKSTRAPRGANAKTVVASALSAKSNGSKIIMSNLPSDVDETQIKAYHVHNPDQVAHDWFLGLGTTLSRKSTLDRILDLVSCYGTADAGNTEEYLTKSVRVTVKRCMLTYGPNGKSRGVATVFFKEADAASKATHALDGTKIDGKPLKVEVVLESSQVPAPAPPKGLSERIVQPKGRAKTATAATGPKPVSKGDATRGGRRGRTARGRNAGRGKPKSADELDAEMVDYFVGDNAAATTNGTAPGVAVAASGDAGIADEIM